MKSLYFIRHGQSEWNAIGRMQGQRNSDLSELGRGQADVNGRLLATLGIEAIYASPLDRARQTAQIIQRHVSHPVVYDERIQEWDCGDWSGHLRSDVGRRWPEEWAALGADRFHYRGPNCENYPDMIARTTPFIDEILAAPANRIAIVSHGVIGRVMIGITMGMTPLEMVALTQPNDVVYCVRCGAEPDAPRSIEHYESGSGPIAGVQARVAAPSA